MTALANRARGPRLSIWDMSDAQRRAHFAERAQVGAMRALGKPVAFSFPRLQEARQLQHQGKTLREIAEALDVDRVSVVKALYTEVIR